MASLTSIQDPENQQDIEAKKRERATLISVKQAEKLRICGGFDGRRYVKGTLAEEITRLENTCVITGASCDMEETGTAKNWQRITSKRYKCKDCEKQTTHGGRKKKTRRKKRRKKRRKSRRKKRTRKRRRKKRTKRRK